MAQLPGHFSLALLKRAQYNRLMLPEILYEDNHLLVVNKPAGLLTQGDISGVPSLLDILKTYIKKRDNKPGNVFLGMVQRLDRPVSGVIVFAKTSKAASRLSEQIRARKIEKIYICMSAGSEIQGRGYTDWQEIRSHLLRVRDKTVIAECAGIKTQLGILAIKTLYDGSRARMNLIRLITGRKHQIRAQLAHLGQPLSGDRKYGSTTDYPIEEGIGLHAYYCGLNHPVKQESIGVLSDVPVAMLHCFSRMERVAIITKLAQEIECIKK